MQDTKLTGSALAALSALQGSSRFDVMPGSAVARVMWPDRLKEMRTSLRRGGLYRAAGAVCSRLVKSGLAGHFMDDFYNGYYITEAGRAALEKAAAEKL
jgi:hypothetical protein